MKFVKKTRTGAKVKKKHDIATTPYNRLLKSKHIEQRVKEKLKSQYVKLNPAQLKRNITRLQNKLMKLTAFKQKQSKDKKNFGYIFDEATNQRFEYFFK